MPYSSFMWTTRGRLYENLKWNKPTTVGEVAIFENVTFPKSGGHRLSTKVSLMYCWFKPRSIPNISFVTLYVRLHVFQIIEVILFQTSAEVHAWNFVSKQIKAAGEVIFWTFHRTKRVHSLKTRVLK